MPQINQLSAIFSSQLFWLVVVFGIVYFVIGRGMVPKIRSTVDERGARIAADLAAAEQARADADATEEAWRAKMNEARVEAARVTQEAKDASARDTEAKVKQSAGKIAEKVDAAETKIRDSAAAARSQLEAFAAEATQDMVSRLTGMTIDQKDAAAAVKAEFHV